MIAPTQTTVKPDVYARKAIVTRKRNAASDARFLAGYNLRRQEAKERIEAIYEANKVKEDAAWKEQLMEQIDSIPDDEAEELAIVPLQTLIDEGEQTAEYEDYLADVEFWRSGQW